MSANPKVVEKEPQHAQLQSIQFARPFLKWAGGKGQLLKQILSFMPNDIENYYEPFLGGGAVFFGLENKPKQAFLSDVSSDLINCFEVVKNDLNALCQDLATHQHSEEYYYKIREVDRIQDYQKWSKVKRASRFIYLNKTCYNGLYRVNSKGQFNVPFGKYKNPKILDEKNLTLCSKALSCAKLSSASYEKVLEHVGPGDFLYLDPPYHPRSMTSSFTSYTVDGFSQQMQITLKEFCDELHRRQARFLLSNSYTTLILHLYQDYEIEVVDASRAINSVGSKRGKQKELLISNF